MRVSNTAERLKLYMTITGMKQSDILERIQPVAKKYGIKFGKSALSQYVSGIVEPKQDKLTVLSETLGVSETWLMGYDVPMEKETAERDATRTEEEKEMYKLFQSVPKEKQKELLDLIESALKLSKLKDGE